MLGGSLGASAAQKHPGRLSSGAFLPRGFMVWAMSLQLPLHFTQPGPLCLESAPSQQGSQPCLH